MDESTEIRFLLCVVCVWGWGGGRGGGGRRDGLLGLQVRISWSTEHSHGQRQTDVQGEQQDTQTQATPSVCPCCPNAPSTKPLKADGIADVEACVGRWGGFSK